MAKFVLERVPNAIGFTVHPDFPGYKYCTAFLSISCDQYNSGWSWPLYLFDQPPLDANDCKPYTLVAENKFCSDWVDRRTLDKHLEILALKFEEGRSDIAPTIDHRT